VTTIERHASLAEAARARLAALGIDNVTVLVGDGTLGVPDSAPFDRILVTAGAPSIPAALQNQLVPGGRLLMPVGPPALQYLTAVDRRDDGFETRSGSACVFVPLIGEGGWSA
jgi:protein-L-isoaspartate(D-aspartate) O-methyltransferase